MNSASIFSSAIRCSENGSSLYSSITIDSQPVPANALAKAPPRRYG
jgi:hypothetical protein